MIQSITIAIAAFVLVCSSHMSYAGETYTDSFSYQLLSRSYDYYIPDNIKTNTPVLIMLHGFTSSKKEFQKTEIRGLAEQHGLVIMWPNGATAPLNSWNGHVCCAPSAILLNLDDNGFVRKAIDRLKDRVKERSSGSIDETRVYSYGHSNGGIMTHRLGLQSADKIAAIAPTAYAIDSLMTWKPVRPVPVLTMHALDDATVPYDGGLIEGFPSITNPLSDSAETGRETWARLNGCSGMTSELHPNGNPQADPEFPRVDTYADCKQNVSVSLISFRQGGHGPFDSAINGGVEVFEEVIAFLSRYQKPGHKSDRIWEGQELHKGQYLRSPDQNMKLLFQSDSNLVLTNQSTGETVWASNTKGSDADRLVMQGDDNLVLYKPGYWGWKKKKVGWFSYYVWTYFPTKAVWASNTNNLRSGEARVQLNNSGKLTILVDDYSVWSRN